MDQQIKKTRCLNGDLNKIMTLISLYIIQGAAFGFFGMTLPVMMKQHFTYTEIGIISLCTMGFKFKFLFAFIVDTKYIDSIGKRKTWIIPSQIIAAIVMIYLGNNINSLIDERAIYTITGWFSLIFFALSIQDIAVDAWALTIVKKENKSYASVSQNVGLTIGAFLGNTGYFAFSSIDFGNNYIRAWYVPSEELIKSAQLLSENDDKTDGSLYNWSDNYSEPFFTQQNFMIGWGYFMIVTAIYLLVWHDEKKDGIKIKEEDQIQSISLLFKEVKSFIFSRNLIMLNSLWGIFYGFTSFTSYVGTIYLLDELKYSRTKYSFISLLLLPFDLLVSWVSSKFVFKYTFQILYFGEFVMYIFGFVITNLLYYNYHEICAYDEFLFDILIFSVFFLSSIMGTLIGNAKHASFNHLSDPKVGGVHMTFLTSTHNMCLLIPKIYTYKIVDLYGIFTPNLIGLSIGIVALISFRPMVKELQKVAEDKIKSEVDVKQKVE